VSDKFEELIEQAVDRRMDNLLAMAAPVPSSAERLTSQQLAAHLKVHPKTVRNWALAGCPCLYVGQRPRFLISEVEDWLKTRVDGRAEWRKGAKSQGKEA
jgi:hypothetical protein